MKTTEQIVHCNRKSSYLCATQHALVATHNSDFISVRMQQVPFSVTLQHLAMSLKFSMVVT